MKVYISGPMTGIENYNMPAFYKAAEKLSSLGFLVVLPVPFQENKTYKQYLAEDISELLKCDKIYMLDGWQGSTGAKIEKFIADSLGISEAII